MTAYTRTGNEQENKNKQPKETKQPGIDMTVRMIYKMQKYLRVFRITIYDNMAEIPNSVKTVTVDGLVHTFQYRFWNARCFYSLNLDRPDDSDLAILGAQAPSCNYFEILTNAYVHEIVLV